jgi:predicted RNase H-like nuclease
MVIMNGSNNMKKISELGLELIELEDQVLLVDKNSKIEKGDLFEFDTLICTYDGTYHLSAGREHKIIASTKPLEGIPLLVIEN